MTKLEVRDVLLVEAHRILKEEAKRAVQKIGKPIPQEARPGYLTDEDISILKQLGTANLDHPAMRKSMRASAARSEVLSYPSKEVLSSEELGALEALKLPPAALTAVERVVANACASTLRGKMLSQLRTLIKQADPEVVEEWKWRGVPVWSHDGLICTGETYKNVVKMTFSKGAALEDPSGLFNSSLDGNTGRAIDFHEDEKIDEEALKALIRAAVTLNASRARG